MEQIEKEIIELLLATKRQGILEVASRLKIGGFFEAPASLTNHLACDGGLAIHSLSVYKTAMKIYDNIIAGMNISADKRKKQTESITIASLLHDTCKIDGYTYDEKKKKFIKNPNAIPFGHGEKSAIKLLQWGLGLTDAEIAAIRWHMGAWCLDRNSLIEIGDYNLAKKKYPLVTIIETADFLSSNLLEDNGTVEW